MLLAETFIKIAQEVGLFTKQKTEINAVDAYFGPKSLLRGRKKNVNLEKLQMKIEESLEHVQFLNNRLQGKFLQGQFTAFLYLLKWLSGERIGYLTLVENLLGIKPYKLPEKMLAEKREKADQLLQELGAKGKDAYSRAAFW